MAFVYACRFSLMMCRAPIHQTHHWSLRDVYSCVPCATHRTHHWSGLTTHSLTSSIMSLWRRCPRQYHYFSCRSCIAGLLLLISSHKFASCVQNDSLVSTCVIEVVTGCGQKTAKKRNIWSICTFVTGCASYEFQCANNQDCVYMAWRCDGEADCSDASDEEPNMCGQYCTSY